jgi:isoleucyl-tRNA synthetase
MGKPIFQPLPDKPDHPRLEEEILARWETEGTFAKLREKNAAGPTFSFMDGPITANGPAGVHHGLGRTLKDVFQRYKAAHGHDLRYQNGFDSQGLHVEVQVEKALGFNSKNEIEEFGIDRFARECRDFVAKFAVMQTAQSKRLGMWMDWGNDYFTFSDTNIEYIWRFLKEVDTRGWLYKGHRSTQWCPRCGTSLSKHEQAGEENYEELEHPSLFVRFPLKDRDGQSLVIWTTTPWTLPANVAAAVKPDAEYGRNDVGEWVAVERYPEEHFEERLRGSELVGWEYTAPFEEFAAQEGVVHRVIPWDEVSLDEGTGIVHIAPGCGAEDFELSRVHDLAVLAPIDESGRMLPGYGDLEGRATNEVVIPVIDSLRERHLLVEATSIVHRYPVCWRCRTPLVFRVVDDWFISADEIRQPMLDGNATVEWTPPQYKKRMDDWLRNMGDWNISRRRYFGLPLPFYPCECGHLNVIGSRAELEERAVSGLDQLEELHRPWIDGVRIRCENCDAEVERIPDVGDAWLDAGIVHFSTLGWGNPERIPGGYATGSSAGLSGADLPDNEWWERWFPADWVSEGRTQIRLWFYSQCFMAITLAGTQPYRRVLTYENVVDETGREMHKSWGNAIELDDALNRMGADTMRWLYCSQNPAQELRFGYGLAEDVKRRFLTFWNSVKFFVDYANIAGFRPEWASLEPDAAEPLDRWLVERTHAFVADATAGYDRWDTVDVMREFEAYLDDLSNWYIRRSRRRFWDEDEAALHALWYALVQTLRVLAPVLPFITDDLWRTLVLDGPESVHLAGWPEVPEPDRQLIEDMATVRTVVRLAHQARAATGERLRQPFRRLAVTGAGHVLDHWWDLIADEVRVKDRSAMPVTKFRLKPNLKTLGPRLGANLQAVRNALGHGDEVEQLPNGNFRVLDFELGEDDVLSADRVAVDPTWIVVDEAGIAVALDSTLDDDLRGEGDAYDVIRTGNALRKERGFEITERVVYTVPKAHSGTIEAHRAWIEREVLADEIRLGDDFDVERV